MVTADQKTLAADQKAKATPAVLAADQLRITTDLNALSALSTPTASAKPAPGGTGTKVDLYL